jgi:hypothetical protein
MSEVTISREITKKRLLQLLEDKLYQMTDKELAVAAEKLLDAMVQPAGSVDGVSFFDFEWEL